MLIVAHASRAGVRERGRRPVQRAGRRHRVPAAAPTPTPPRGACARRSPSGSACARRGDLRQLRARVAPGPGGRRDRLRGAGAARRPPRRRATPAGRELIADDRRDRRPGRLRRGPGARQGRPRRGGGRARPRALCHRRTTARAPRRSCGRAPRTCSRRTCCRSQGDQGTSTAAPRRLADFEPHQRLVGVLERELLDLGVHRHLRAASSQELVAVRARQVRDAAHDPLAPQQVVGELRDRRSCGCRRTRRRRLSGLRASATGTSSPAGAKMIALSSSHRRRARPARRPTSRPARARTPDRSRHASRRTPRARDAARPGSRCAPMRRTRTGPGARRPRAAPSASRSAR